MWRYILFGCIVYAYRPLCSHAKGTRPKAHRLRRYQQGPAKEASRGRVDDIARSRLGSGQACCGGHIRQSKTRPVRRLAASTNSWAVQSRNRAARLHGRFYHEGMGCHALLTFRAWSMASSDGRNEAEACEMEVAHRKRQATSHPLKVFGVG